MNSLDDLRRTLDDHARTEAGTPTFDTTALHERITSARRRRAAVRGGVALAAVAAVAAVVVPQLPGGGDGPGPASALGTTVPQTRTVLGVPYELTDVVESASSAEVVVRADDLDASRRPAPVLSWTTTDPHAQVTVTAVGEDGEPDEVVWRSVASRFEDQVRIDQGNERDLRVTSESAGIAAAVYAYDEDATFDGYRKAGFAFPQEERGNQLLAATVSDLGTSSTTVDVTFPGTKVFLGSVCTGFPEGTAVSISMDGEKAFSTGSCDSSQGVGDEGGVTITVDAGSSHTLTVEAVRSFDDDRPLAPEDARGGRVGVLVREGGDSVEIAGRVFDVVVEDRGHLWTMEPRADRAGNGPVTASLDDGGPWVAQAVSEVDPKAGEDIIWAPTLTVDGTTLEGPGPSTSDRTTSSGTALVGAGATSITATPDPDGEVVGTTLLRWSLLD